jgi:NAD(P)-dependent dehydrogenase (short-subunit alcohol dehydrogenase family)
MKTSADEQLIGKKAIVTGGDSGIGRACAVMYGMEGADVRPLACLLDLC